MISFDVLDVLASSFFRILLVATLYPFYFVESKADFLGHLVLPFDHLPLYLNPPYCELAHSSLSDLTACQIPFSLSPKNRMQLIHFIYAFIHFEELKTDLANSSFDCSKRDSIIVYYEEELISTFDYCQI